MNRLRESQVLDAACRCGCGCVTRLIKGSLLSREAPTLRGSIKTPFPPTPNVNRMLADPLIADLIDAAAEDLRYMVRR
jgi:hypothetical protein